MDYFKPPMTPQQGAAAMAISLAFLQPGRETNLNPRDSSQEKHGFSKTGTGWESEGLCFPIITGIHIHIVDQGIGIIPEYPGTVVQLVGKDPWNLPGSLGTLGPWVGKHRRQGAASKA